MEKSYEDRDRTLSEEDIFHGGYQGLACADIMDKKRSLKKRPSENYSPNFSEDSPNLGGEGLREMLKAAIKSGDKQKEEDMEYLLRLRNDPDNIGITSNQ